MNRVNLLPAAGRGKLAHGAVHSMGLRHLTPALRIARNRSFIVQLRYHCCHDVVCCAQGQPQRL